jgi:hypothetical protein
LTALVGRGLALAAHPVCRAVDPDQIGLVIADVQAALVAAGIEIGGKAPRQVLGTALKDSQDMFDQAPGSRWRWIEPVARRGEGLSGMALAEEAYPVAMGLDPDRQGLHYGTLMLALIDRGVIIRGTNPGQTMFRALNGATRWFEWISSATFRWKP